MKALSHPLRVRMLTLLNQKVSSPSELADELDEPLGNVSYHMRFLADLKMVKLVRTEPRRGAVEHYYEALEPPLISDDDWAQLPVALRRSLSDSTLGDIARDLEGAAADGRVRPGEHARQPTGADTRRAGLGRAVGVLAEVLERARDIQEQSQQAAQGPTGVDRDHARPHAVRGRPGTARQARRPLLTTPSQARSESSTRRLARASMTHVTLAEQPASAQLTLII